MNVVIDVLFGVLTLLLIVACMASDLASDRQRAEVERLLGDEAADLFAAQRVTGGQR